MLTKEQVILHEYAIRLQLREELEKLTDKYLGGDDGSPDSDKISYVDFIAEVDACKFRAQSMVFFMAFRAYQDKKVSKNKTVQRSD